MITIPQTIEVWTPVAIPAETQILAKWNPDECRYEYVPPKPCGHFEKRPNDGYDHPMACSNCSFHRDSHAEHFNRSYNEYMAKHHPEEVGEAGR